MKKQNKRISVKVDGKEKFPGDHVSFKYDYERVGRISMIYEGKLVLVTDEGETFLMDPKDCWLDWLSERRDARAQG
jgi:hypothetical protein